tara:strand:- start:657 stop:1154 length:498 start_codon:yes stop_codon:yes gene_type:complete
MEPDNTDTHHWHVEAVLEKWDAEEDHLAGAPPNEVVREDGNLLLNEGITALLNLLTGASEDAFNNSNSYIGIGDSTTTAAASQTGLSASSNKTYKAMESGFPSISGQTVSFKSIFGSGDANYVWNEWTVASGNSDSSDNLNRKVAALGTKVSGSSWTLTVSITVS